MSGGLCIVASGLTSSIGMSAPAALAAARAGLNSFTETRFISRAGTWINGAQVPLSPPTRGRDRLAALLAGPLQECFDAIPDADPASIPILLCVAEKTRPGRLPALDETLIEAAMDRIGLQMNASSAVYAHGSAAGAVALRDARALIDTGAPAVILAGTDSFLTAATLRWLDEHERVLTDENNNGFPAGEAGSAVLLAPAAQGGTALRLLGLGFGSEEATILSDKPLRADGILASIREALAEAGVGFEEVDYRISDLSGEQYYFKEVALSMQRGLRVRKDNMDLWTPTSSFGYCGAAAFPIALAVGLAAAQKGYAPGPVVMMHATDDAGRRATAVFRQEG